MIEIKIKYLDGATKLKRIQQGDWIDVYAYEDVILHQGESALVSLGFAMEFPAKYEAHLAPRSSTFNMWGIIQTNSIGVVDDTYIGDDDQWCMPVYCIEPKSYSNGVAGTWIRKGDKIGQFRIMEVMPNIEFEEVEKLDNKNRGGFGTTGIK